MRVLPDGPLISVVVPTYNTRAYISRAIESVLNQTYQRFEIIIVDNHSTDGTDEVVRGYCDKRIKYFTIHNYGSIAKSRNFGMEQAQGDWIAFLDSDDIWATNKFDVFLAELAKRAEIDIFSSALLIVDKNEVPIRVIRRTYRDRSLHSQLLKRGNCIALSATIVRRSFCLQHNIRFNDSLDYVAAEDYQFWLTMAAAGAQIAWSSEILLFWRCHGTNTSFTNRRYWDNTLNVELNHIIAFVSDSVMRTTVLKLALSRYCLSKSLLSYEPKLGRRLYLLCVAFFHAPLYSLSWAASKVLGRVKGRWNAARVGNSATNVESINR